ncbi:MAG: glycoside hydrolase family 15 protein, partial [Leptospiraceae bacterium]|nr:glycoside hydrolase family 15 protein [Leptospiraceae bacterium]
MKETSVDYDPNNEKDYKPLEAYGLIGDKRTAILVGSDGSIDWACLPDFDSPSVFASILDPKAGRYYIRPVLEYKALQKYETRTNIIVTEFRTKTGVVRIRNFMPYIPNRKVPTAEIHRYVECISGKVELELLFAPRFDYGRKLPEFELSDWGLRAYDKDEEYSITLLTEIKMQVKENSATARFTISAGEETPFVADWGARTTHPVASYETLRQLRRVRKFWQDWIGNLKYYGRYQEQVERSLLILKLLIYEPTGAIVAAPTTSLPEWIGHSRNWDYRYSWVRDSAFILRALFRSGFMEEGINYFDWILQQFVESDIDEKDGLLKVMYGIRGEKSLPETELPLRGYMDSRPVRIGNGAVEQLQLDIYGSLLDAAHLYNEMGGIITITEWEKLQYLVEFVRKNWQKPDSGIWEVRSEPKHHTYSKVWAWVAMDRGIKIAKKLRIPAPIEKWEEVRNEIQKEVLARAWNPWLKAFTSYYGSSDLDASILVMPEVGFIDVKDSQFQSSLDAIIKHLVSGELPLLYRYLSDDGVGGKEGAFLLPSFWLVDLYAMSDDLQNARKLFESLIGMASPMGLLGEEIHPETQEMLGNYPQGFSHLGLVNAAW